MKKIIKAKKIYFVQGMHCSTCEVLINQDIKNIEGINSVKVSLSSSKVEILSDNQDNIPDIDYLNTIFKDLGYTFHSQKLDKKLTRQDIIKIFIIGLLFVVLFYKLESSGFFLKYAVTSQSSLLSYFLFGIAAGMSSCAVLVGGLLLSLSKQWNNLYNSNSKQSIKPFIYFNFSRIIAFTVLGGLLGYIGSMLQISIEWTSLLTIIVSLIMLILGFQMIGITWFHKFKISFFGGSSYLDKNKEIQGKYVPLIAGALTFFIPCGFTLIAQTNALNSGNPFLGASRLLAFVLGTLPILALISFTSVKFYSNPKFSKKFSLFSGILIVFFSLYTLNSQFNVLGFPSLSDINLKPSTKSVVTKSTTKLEYQVLQMEASGLDYFPRYISLQSGVKTEWQIYDNGALGCARAVYARGLYPDVIQLKPGLNSVEFIAPKPGIYKISCSMGMVSPVTVEVY